MNDEFPTSVADWAVDYPESVAIFTAHGIDYCCGGRSVEYACEQAGANPAVVLSALRQLAKESAGRGPKERP